MQSLPLATNATGSWHLAFIQNELHAFVGFAAAGALPSPLEGMTIEDFLVARARDDLQQEARDSLARLLIEITSGQSYRSPP